MTEKQSLFLEHLFGAAKGNLREAARMAGYSDNTSLSEIVDPLADKIHEETKKYISRSAAKAAVGITDLIDDPVQLGANHKLAAARDILDRSGFKPTDKVEVETKSPLFILPAKDETVEDET